MQRCLLSASGRSGGQRPFREVFHAVADKITIGKQLMLGKTQGAESGVHGSGNVGKRIQKRVIEIKLFHGCFSPLLQPS